MQTVKQRCWWGKIREERSKDSVYRLCVCLFTWFRLLQALYTLQASTSVLASRITCAVPSKSITHNASFCTHDSQAKSRPLCGFKGTRLGICYNAVLITFSRHCYPKRLTVHSGYTFIVSMCVPWELNPRPFALLTQCSTTEPQEH